MLLSLMLIGCGNTQPVQDTEDIALTEAPMEEEQVSPEEKTFDSLVKLDEGIYMMDCYTDYLVDEYLAENITETEQLDVWFTENLTQGVPTGDIPDTGCSSFAICDGDGNHLLRSMAKKKGNDIHSIVSSHVETVVLMSKKNS